MGIYSWLVQQINFLKDVLKLKQNFQKNRVVLAKLRSLWYIRFVRHILFALTKVSDGEVVYGNALFSILTFPFKKCYLSTLNQRTNNIDRQRSSTLFQRWYLAENETWANVHLSALFQRWQNNVDTRLIELSQFNVDEPMLFQRWNLIENESWADACLKLSQRMFIGVEKTVLKQLCQ